MNGLPGSIKSFLLFLALTLAAAQGCDVEKPDETQDVGMDLVLSFTNNVEQELADKLSYVKDQPIRAALEDYIAPIFSHDVHDVDLSFYDQRKGGIRTCHVASVLDAEEKVISVRLVPSDYRYGAAANLSKTPTVKLADAEKEAELVILQADGTSESHRAGIFSARKRLLVRKDAQDQIASTLSMNNAAVALIINRDSCEVRGIRATIEGLADSFRILDSAYTYDRKTVIKADVIDIEPYIQAAAGSDQDLPLDASPWGYDGSWTQWTKTPLMIAAAGFPSRTFGTTVVNSSVVVWTVNLYVDLADGTTTRNDIYIGQPVLAHHLKIVKGWLQADGSFEATPPLPPTPGHGGNGHEPPTPPTPDDSTAVVGVSVVLNWSKGMSFEPEL